MIPPKLKKYQRRYQEHWDTHTMTGLFKLVGLGKLTYKKSENQLF